MSGSRWRRVWYLWCISVGGLDSVICDAIKQIEPEVEKFYFLAFAICVLFKLSFGENPMEIGQLVQKIQAVEGLQKQ